MEISILVKLSECCFTPIKLAKPDGQSIAVHSFPLGFWCNILYKLLRGIGCNLTLQIKIQIHLGILIKTCRREWYQILFSVYHNGPKSSSLWVDQQQMLRERKGKVGMFDRVGIIILWSYKGGLEADQDLRGRARRPACKADRFLCLHDTI